MATLGAPASIGTASVDWRAAAALSLAALFWSGNFIAGRALRDAVDPVTLNTLRWALAGALFLPFTARGLLQHAGVIRQHWRYVVALGATGIAGFHTMVYIALSQTMATHALLILALAPVAILAGSVAMGGSRPAWLQWAGAACSLGGAALLITRGDAMVLRSLDFNRGDLWMLAAVLVWAAYSLLLKRRPPGLSPTVSLAASMGCGLALMLPVYLLQWPSSHLDAGTAVWGALAYVVIFPSVLAFWLWNYGVARIGPERSGPFVNLMPIFGAVLAVAILGERIVPAQWPGAAMVLTGIVPVLFAGRSSKDSMPAPHRRRD